MTRPSRLGRLMGGKRILRGGCFNCPAPYCRTANRYAAPQERQAPNFGFRVAWSASEDMDDGEH